MPIYDLFLLVYHRICSFVVIHRIIFHVNPNSYTAWLGAVDRQYPAYLLELRTPPPPFGWQPPSPALEYMVIRPSDWIACSPGHVGRRLSRDTQECQIWALEFSLTVLRSSRACLRLCIRFWISLTYTDHHHFHLLSSPFSYLIITIFIPYHCHLSSSLRNLELLFQPPEWKQVVLLFPSYHGFARILPWFCHNTTNRRISRATPAVFYASPMPDFSTSSDSCLRPVTYVHQMSFLCQSYAYQGILRNWSLDFSWFCDRLETTLRA